MDKQQYVSSMEAIEPLLYHIAWSMLRSPQDVEDAMQETALRAWEKRASLRSQEHFRPWAARIMVNVCNNTLHRRKRQVPVAELPDAAVSDDNDAALALASLPEKLRLPMVLCYVQGMTDREIAAILRVPVTTVRGRINRAKKQLRKELAE